MTRGSLQESVLGPVVININIKGIDSTVECTFSKFSDDSKLSDAVDRYERQDSFHMDLERLKK